MKSLRKTNSSARAVDDNSARNVNIDEAIILQLAVSRTAHLAPAEYDAILLFVRDHSFRGGVGGVGGQEVAVEGGFVKRLPVSGWFVDGGLGGGGFARADY